MTSSLFNGKIVQSCPRTKINKDHHSIPCVPCIKKQHDFIVFANEIDS